MIYHYDIRYSLAKLPVKTTLRLNFRKLVFIDRKENVSRKKPVIFAANHRNALLDALMLVYSSYHCKQVVFLARADIFKQKFVAWLLKGLRIIPVFRIRDGKENLERNDEVFKTAARVLKKNNPIALFPEGRHNPKQSLLPIQKAVPRIVLPTEASLGFELQSQIVPVAIYYRDVNDFPSDAYVTFGQPIEVSEYKTLYSESPNLAINQLRKDLETRLKSMVVDIWNDEFTTTTAWRSTGTVTALQRNIPWSKRRLPSASLHIVRELDRLFELDPERFQQKIDELREAKQLLQENGLTSKDRVWKRPSKWNLFAVFRYFSLPSPSRCSAS